MAQNLRAKIPEADTLLIHDQNRETARKFKEASIAAAGAGAEGKGKGKEIEVAESSREVAAKSVRAARRRPSLPLVNNDEHVSSHK